VHGKFVVFDGIDGSGKTTQRELVRNALVAAGIDVIVTREPGGTPISEEIRSVLLSPNLGDFSGTTEMLLVFAARAQHLDQLIRPRLESGTWVLCDRFSTSTFAYQVRARGLSESLFNTLCQEVIGDTRPDFSFLFDLPEEIASSRVGQRFGQQDRFDLERTEFFRLARAGYREIAERDGHIRIDASRSIEEVTQAILAHLLP